MREVGWAMPTLHLAGFPLKLVLAWCSRGTCGNDRIKPCRAGIARHLFEKERGVFYDYIAVVGGWYGQTE